ncbi:Glucosamine-6-phosphate isomerase (Glucosamine-6-phosphate deaminase) (GNPDA) (GlcN6P deaminase) [Basidiobolus ranarum]|uniref:Beta-hexosaminidase n=1 Tax=Basidiobolus ranarum TaxID=34480 RepID=A0ABR2WIU8_9FUNG
MVAIKLLSTISLFAASSLAWVWPLPAKMDVGNTIIRVDKFNLGFSIKAPAGSDILERAVERYKKLIFIEGEYGSLLDTVEKTVFPTPTTSVPTQAPAPKGTSAILTGLSIVVNGTDTKLNLDTDESYSLDVPAQGGQATLKANSVYGALRGLESFSQLIKWTEETNQYRIPLAPVSITDKPAFPHRGVMIDSSRNFLKIADIKRTIDGMSYNKLNVLHWHIIDQHSFPVQTKTYPELSEKGAYSKRWVYTEADIRGIVSYAKDRGVRVVPEFDIPGHAYTWGLAFPEIVSCMNTQPNWSDHAAEPSSGQLNIINPKTDVIVRNFLKEVTQWFDDEFVHIGGDEVNFKCWESSPGYPEYLSSHNTTLDILLEEFIVKSHGWVRENKKIPITWQEALTNHHIPMGKDVAVQVWLGASDALKVVRAGYRVIATSYERWYLDCGRGAWISDSQGNSWCDPYKSWQIVYNYDLTANMTKEESKLVIGGEVALWAEQIDSINIDRVLWPRGAAAAEVLWSDIKLADGTIRKTGDVFPRIHEQRARLVDRGIAAEPMQPLWCARNPRNC